MNEEEGFKANTSYADQFGKKAAATVRNFNGSVLEKKAFDVSVESYNRYRALLSDFRSSFYEIKKAMNDDKQALAMDKWHESLEQLDVIQRYFEGSYVLQ